MIIRILENNKVHGQDYNKINCDNFNHYGNPSNDDYIVGKMIIHKNYPDWLLEGACYKVND
jgi:hypothetical protein